MSNFDERSRRELGQRRRVVLERKTTLPTVSTLGPGEVCIYGQKIYINDNGTIRSFNAGSAGEANTASNVGSAGVGVFKQKTGVDLEFKKINAGSSKVTVTDDTVNNEVDIDVSLGSIDHGGLAGLADDDHTQYVKADGTRNIDTSLGSFKIGDLTFGNETTEFGIDGTIKFNGNATVFGRLDIQPGDFIPSGTPPGNAGYKAGYSLAFDGGGTLDERAGFRISLPGDYKEGSDIYVYAHWTPQDNTGGTVRWELAHSWANVDDTFPAATTVYAEIAAGTVTDKHLRSLIATIFGMNMKIDSVLLAHFGRNATHANDTYNNKDAYLHCLRVYYEKDQVGSSAVTTK